MRVTLVSWLQKQTKKFVISRTRTKLVLKILPHEWCTEFYLPHIEKILRLHFQTIRLLSGNHHAAYGRHPLQLLVGPVSCPVLLVEIFF